MDFTSSMDDLMSKPLPPEETQTKADLKPAAKKPAPKKPAPKKPEPKPSVKPQAETAKGPPMPVAEEGMSGALLLGLAALGLGVLYYLKRK